MLPSSSFIFIFIFIYIYIYIVLCRIVLVSLHINHRMEGKRKVCIMDECDKIIKDVEVEGKE